MAVISLINELISEVHDEIDTKQKNLDDLVERSTKFLEIFYKSLDSGISHAASNMPRTNLGEVLEKFFAPRPSLKKIVENREMVTEEIFKVQSKPGGTLPEVQNIIQGLIIASNINVLQKQLDTLREKEERYRALVVKYLTEQTTLDSTLKELSDRLSRVEKTTGVVGGSAKKHTRKGRRPDSKRQKRPNTRKHY